MSDEDAVEHIYAALAMAAFIIAGEDPDQVPLLAKTMAKDMMRDEQGLSSIAKRLK